MELQDVQVFVTVAELGSFSSAAEKEHLPASSVTRKVRKLEDKLGTRLLDRSTRAVCLTEDGRLFYKRALHILEEMDDVQRLLRGRHTHPEGTLRIGGPEEVLKTDLHKLLITFAQHQPQLCIDFHPGTDIRNIYTRNLDLMFHIDAPTDSDLIAQQLTTATTNYYASPGYLSQYGEPKSPQDVVQHRCIVEQRNWLNNVNHWNFRDGEGVIELPVTPHYRAESTFICIRLTAAGLGIALLPDHHCAPYLKTGKLVKLFNGEHEFLHSLYTLYPSRRYVPLKVKTLLEFLNDEMPERL